MNSKHHISDRSSIHLTPPHKINLIKQIHSRFKINFWYLIYYTLVIDIPNSVSFKVLKCHGAK